MIFVGIIIIIHNADLLLLHQYIGYHVRLLAGLQVLQAIVDYAFHVGQWCIVKHNQNVVVQLLLYRTIMCIIHCTYMCHWPSDLMTVLIT